MSWVGWHTNSASDIIPRLCRYWLDRYEAKVASPDNSERVTLGMYEVMGISAARNMASSVM